MKDEEIRYFLGAVQEIVENIRTFEKEYVYVSSRNEYIHSSEAQSDRDKKILDSWFSLD
jgi:hypothetical protein